jgi:3-dehydroquinate synthase
MGRDKKVHAGRMRLVVPKRIGNVVVRDDVPEAVIRNAINAVLD